MGWINISNYLSKFKDFKPSKQFFKEEVLKTIKKVTGIDIASEEVEIRGGNINFKIKNPVFKNQIFIKKEPILSELKNVLGSRSPKDIKF